MNYRMIIYLLGLVLLIIGAVMLLPCLVALVYAEAEGWDILLAAGICAVTGGLSILCKPRTKKSMHARDGFVMVSLSWIVISLVGALPFWLSGAIKSYIDALFETVSGFTTTGASILTDVEALPHCLLFWRSFSHWLGGMGVLVFMLAIVPMSGDSIFLLKAESPGPSVSKMVPKMRTTALILYGIYAAMTLLQLILYRVGVVFGWGEMSFFDSVCLTLGTAGTGGFAIRADGLAGYSMYEQALTTVFMILFGVNFSIYFFIICKKFKLAWNNSELKAYVSIILVAIVLITANLALTDRLVDGSLGDTVHHTAFSVGSVITTTGYGTVDFAQWPEFSKMILLLLMVSGACAGSTGGGMKVSRLLILFKFARAEVRHLVHPRAVEVMTMDKKRVSNDVIRGTTAYFIVYVALMALSVVLVSFDGFGTETTLSSVFATFNNIGPGLSELVGPFGSFAPFSDFSKIVMILGMLFGRLEIFPMLLLLRPSTWRKHG